MARFGLTDDSDEDDTLRNTNKTPKPPIAVQKGKGKGKARAVSPPLEADELATPPRRRPQRPTTNALIEDDKGDYRYAREAHSRDSTDSSEEENEVERDRRPRIVQQPTPWPSKIGMEPYKIHVMQTSLFRVPEEEAAIKAAAERSTMTGKTKSQQQAERLLNASARLVRKHSRGSDTGGEVMQIDKAEVRWSLFPTHDPD